MGIVALVRSDAVAPGPAARVFGWIAVVGIVLTVPGELLLIPVAGSDINGAAASTVSTVYGIAVLLTDIGLIGYGVLALRQRHWPAGRRLLPLVFCLFQLLVVTPVSLAAGFASTASFVAIALSDVLLVAIGLGVGPGARGARAAGDGRVGPMTRWAARTATVGGVIQIGYGVLAWVSTRDFLQLDLASLHTNRI